MQLYQTYSASDNSNVTAEYCSLPDLLNEEFVQMCNKWVATSAFMDISEYLMKRWCDTVKILKNTVISAVYIIYIFHGLGTELRYL